MYSSLLIDCVSNEINEVIIHSGPHEILGPCQFIGAFPDEDLVLLSSMPHSNYEVLNNSFINTYFNTDNEDIYGNVIIVKTDTNGNPVDLKKCDIVSYL